MIHLRYHVGVRAALVALVVAGAAAAVAAEAADGRRWRLPAKTAASAAFVALGALAWTPGDPSGAWLLLGLTLAAVGDVALALEGGFAAGLAAFLAAHLAYLAGFAAATGPRSWPWWPLVPLAAAAASVWLWLEPHLGRLRWAVAAYVVVITLMVWGAASLAILAHAPPRLAAGALLFYLSDLAVARHRFVRAALVNRAVGLPLYYLGQVLIAFSVGATGPHP